MICILRREIGTGCGTGMRNDAPSPAHILDPAGHLSVVEQPQAFGDALERFLAVV